MQLIRATIFIAAMVGAFLWALNTLRAQPQQQGPTIEQRIGAEMGPTIVRAAALAGQVDQLQAIVAQRDKTIAELQAQIAELKKDPPK